MNNLIYHILDKKENQYIKYTGPDDWHLCVTPDGNVYNINTVGQLFDHNTDRYEIEIEK